MAKKTLALRYKTHDAALSMKRKFLYYKKDEREIRYDVDPVPETATPTPVTSNIATNPNTVAPVVATVTPSPAPPQNTPTVMAARMADTPVTAKEIVITIIAQKLKKVFSGVPTDKSIKQLVGGMSSRSFCFDSIDGCQNNAEP
jgi:fatty acid synthase subunit alpha